MQEYNFLLKFVFVFNFFAFANYINGASSIDVATNNQFKHHVAVNVIWSDDRSLFCGGSILSSKWVITAANCLTVPENLATFGKAIKSVHIIAGETLLGNNNESNNRQEVKASKFVVPQNYDRRCVDWDVGLILLLKDLEFTEIVQSIKIPEPENNLRLDSSCQTAGWSVSQNKTRSQFLRWGTVKVLKKQKCMDYFDGFEITSLKICVSIWLGSKNGCHGDLGGSLACAYTKNGAEEYYLYGVENFGVPAKDCGVSETTTVYTRINKYSGWIDCVTNSSEGLNSSSVSRMCDKEILSMSKKHGLEYQCYKSGIVKGEIYLIVILSLLFSCVVFYLYKRRKALKQEKKLKERLVLKKLEEKFPNHSNSKDDPKENMPDQISSPKEVTSKQATVKEIIKEKSDSVSVEIQKSQTDVM